MHDYGGGGRRQRRKAREVESTLYADASTIYPCNSLLFCFIGLFSCDIIFEYFIVGIGAFGRQYFPI